MSQPEESRSPTGAELEDTLRRLEARIARLEEYLQLGPLPESPAPGSALPGATAHRAAPPASAEAREEALELNIGEFWLARVGIVALLMGTAFFIAYPLSVLPPLLHTLIGFAGVAGLLAVSRVWRTSYSYLSRILFGGGLVLLYYAVLRLYFFTAHPLLASRAVALIALSLVVGLHFFMASRRGSEFLTGVAVFIGYLTALLCDAAHLTFPIIALVSVAAVGFLLRHGYKIAGLLAVVLAYVAHLFWLLNNPLLGHPLQAVTEHQYNLVYLFLYAAVFAVPHLVRSEAALAESVNVLLPLLNGTGFYGMVFLVMLTFFKESSAAVNFSAAVLFLMVAIAAYEFRQNHLATSTYACFGYLALSAAIFAKFAAPNYFIWLGWQSLLVISTAIWFRSKIVVVANAFIYLGIFLAYLVSSASTDAVNASYALVALLSARLLNWKTERLALQTELMRNAYLASAFVIIPYGLYHGVPKNYVSLSWLGAAGFYFVMSMILKNKKYRWMAILTIFLSVIHVFAVDLARLEAEYRIISFLALGLVLLFISLLYARSRRKAALNGQETDHG